MPKAVKKVVKKAVKKPVRKAKPKAKKPAYECAVCGYRLVTDTDCGCAEEHVFLCCGQPMAKK